MIILAEILCGLAWLVFSGNKHEKYPEADELIAIVYNSVFEVLKRHAA
jgi:hypothetical protein